MVRMHRRFFYPEALRRIHLATPYGQFSPNGTGALHSCRPQWHGSDGTQLFLATHNPSASLLFDLKGTSNPCGWEGIFTASDVGTPGNGLFP